MIAEFQATSVLLILVWLSIFIGILVAFACIATILTKRYGILALLGFVVCVLIVPGVGIMALWLTGLEKAAVKREQASGIALVTAGDSHPDQTANVRLNTTANAIAKNSAIRVTPVADPPPAAWSSADLGEFQANLYPGMKECMAPLARKIGDAVENEGMPPTGDADQENEKVVFTVFVDDSLGSESGQCYDQFVDALAERFPDVQLSAGDADQRAPSTKPKKHELFLSLSASVQSGKIALPPVVTSNRRVFHSLPSSSGKVKCQAVGSDRKANATATFIQKTWVNQFDQLVSAIPQKQFVVGYSQELSSSEPLARQSAMENAQSQIRVHANTHGGINTLIDVTHVVDRFAQKLTRPYGDVWREAVLIDVTGEAMQGTIAAAEARAARDRGIKKGGALLAVLLLLAIIAVCFIGNAVTQGYYRRPLNWGASAVGALIVFAVIILGFTQH